MWAELIAEFTSQTVLAWPVLALRLMGAAFFCATIGWDREQLERPAGLRTHILVGIAAAVFCLITMELTGRFDRDGIQVDPVRIVEAVTAGVAFLAAGSIVFAKGKVSGLTTGAGLWLAGAIGVACGLGLWMLAAMTTLLALLVINVLRRLEHWAPKGNNHGQN